MERLNGDSETRDRKNLPTVLWIYFATFIIFAAVAIAFSTLTFHPTAFYIALYAVLLTGLLTGSRLCRRLLTFLSAFTAYGLLMVEIGASDPAGILLVVLPLAQVVLLCTPRARFFASH